MKTYSGEASSFHKDEVNRTYNQQERKDMIPMEVLPLEQYVGYNGKHTKADTFLNDFQLNERKWASVFLKADTVGRNLTTILEKGYPPRKSDDAYQRPLCRHAGRL